MIELNEVEADDSATKNKPVKALHRQLSLFGSLAQIRLDMNYFLKKDKLSLLDKRLLMGIF